MKTLVILMSSLTLVGFLSYKNFLHTQKSQLRNQSDNARIYNRMFDDKSHELYLLNDSQAELKSVIFLDSILTNDFTGYSELKQREYTICMNRGNFNEPLSDAMVTDLFKIVNANILSEKDSGVFISLFRVAVIFRIIDERKMPIPKEYILKDFKFII